MARKNIVIVDIDGTICVPDPERLKHAHVDWDKFYQDRFDDPPIPEMVDLVKYLAKRYTVVYCTARQEKARVKTLNWFDKHGLPYDNKLLLMRPDGDERPTAELKPGLVQSAGVRLNQIAFVLEDHVEMTKVWREKGVRVLQVDANGLQNFL